MRTTSVPDMGTRKGKKNVAENEKFAIIKIEQLGMKHNDIAVQFKLSRSTVSKLLKRTKNETVTVLKNRGRKPKLNAAAIRIL